MEKGFGEIKEMKEENIQVLEAVELTKNYNKRMVVNKVSLDINAGEVVGLIGPNGAGKTTTFYMIIGLISPDQGSVFLNGEDIGDLPMYQRARRGITYLPQEPSVLRKLTVEENLLAVLETLNLPREEKEGRLQAFLSELNITHLAKTKAFSLSGGERRRVEITRSLILDPSVILLDEPFAGIDPLAIVDIQNIVRQLKDKGLGVIVTDHNVREIFDVCDRAYVLNEGRILEEGTPGEISASKKARKIYLGEDFGLEKKGDAKGTLKFVYEELNKMVDDEDNDEEIDRCAGEIVDALIIGRGHPSIVLKNSREYGNLYVINPSKVPQVFSSSTGKPLAKRSKRLKAEVEKLMQLRLDFERVNYGRMLAFRYLTGSKSKGIE